MRKSPFIALGLLAAIILLAFGCRSSEQPEQAGEAAAPVEAEAPADPLAVDVEIPQGGDASMESASGESDPACVGRLETAEEETIELSGWKATRAGYRVSLEREGDEPEALALGVIADIKEDTGENLLNIVRYIEWWRAEGVEAVVVAGDAGETEQGIVRAVSALAEPGWPVFVIVGNREARDVYRGAMDALGEQHSNVFDLNQVRLVELPEASLVSLPGYHDPRFLHTDTGCQYFREDVAALVSVAEGAEDPVVLVAHSGPRGSTPRAIDYAREAGNVGDANINRLIAAAGIPFGIFAHIHEAGGKATDLLGKDLIAQATFADSLYLNVGPADSIPWAMNDETTSHGMAGIFRVSGAKAAYEIKRLEALTEQQIAEARRLEAEPVEEEAEDAE